MTPALTEKRAELVGLAVTLGELGFSHRPAMGRLYPDELIHDGKRFYVAESKAAVLRWLRETGRIREGVSP